MEGGGDRLTGKAFSNTLTSPKLQVVQKCAKYQETLMKLLSTCEVSDATFSNITTVVLAQLRFLQEEYTGLIVSNQFDDGTAKLFQTLQQNPAAFTPTALENLQRAVTIAGARQNRQVSAADRPRGRGSFFTSEQASSRWFGPRSSRGPAAG